MPAADLDGPLSDFTERAKQAREIMVVVESAGRQPNALTTQRAGVDLTRVGIQTGNTANSMAMMFLASAFEEFVREGAVQCGNYLMDKYASMPPAARHAIRDSYWKASRDQLKFTKSVLTNKSPDAALIAHVRAALEALQGFVVSDDASKLASSAFGYHANNFRPGTVEEILGRLGISKLMNTISESSKLKNYFGVSKKDVCETKLKAKWNEFYDRRNETVHSLGGSSGYAVELVFDYIAFFELIAEALKAALSKSIAAW